MRLTFMLAKLFVLGCILSLSGCATSDYATKVHEQKIAVTSKNLSPVLLIANFDSGSGPNNIGGSFGVWDKDPNDDTQYYKKDFMTPGYDGAGMCLKLSYDVDSPNVAFGGFWMKLESIDVRPFNKLSFWLKGDAAGFTKKFKIELKNQNGESSSYYVTSTSDVWDVVEIPLSSFKKITDWSKMSEFVIVFEGDQVTSKIGAVYVDDVSFVK